MKLARDQRPTNGDRLVTLKDPSPFPHRRAFAAWCRAHPDRCSKVGRGWTARLSDVLRPDPEPEPEQDTKRNRGSRSVELSDDDLLASIGYKRGRGTK